MKPRSMNVVIGGKRYRTDTATLLASGPSGRGHLSQAGAEPEPILEVRLGGVELGALLLMAKPVATWITTASDAGGRYRLYQGIALA